MIQNTKMRRAILVLQDKGGAGRTICAALLAEWLRASGSVRVALFSVDDGQQALAGVFGAGGTSPLCAPHRFDRVCWRDRDRAMPNTDIVLKCLGGDGPQQSDVSVFDVPANSTQFMLRWIDDTGVVSFAADECIGITVVVPVDCSGESARGAQRIADALGKQVDLVFVRNSRGSARMPWDQLKEQGSILAMPSCEIDLPRIPEGLCVFREELALRGGMPLFSSLPVGVPLEVRAESESYWAEISRVFGTVADSLLP